MEEGNATSCPALLRNISVTVAQPFWSTDWIETGHDITPRFGHTNNITSVINSNSPDYREYIIGLSATSIIIFSFFAVWMLVLVVLKCLGYSMVGFFSGSNVRVPPPPAASILKSSNNYQHGNMYQEEVYNSSNTQQQQLQEDGDDMHNMSGFEENTAIADWERQLHRRERRIRNIRICVLVCGLIIIGMSVVMIVFGISSLRNSVRDGLDGLDQSYTLTVNATELIDTYLTLQDSTYEAGDNVRNELTTGVCADYRNILCSDQTQTVFNCDIFDLADEGFIEEELNGFTNSLLSIRKDLVSAGNLITEIEAQVRRFSWAFYVAAGAVLLMAICTLFIMNGVIMAWQKKLHGSCWHSTFSCVRGYVIVPIFVFLLIIGWIFSMVFIIGYTASSDFCYNSPDENVLLILEKNKERFGVDSRLYEMLVYYISGCPPREPASIVVLAKDFIIVTAVAVVLLTLTSQQLSDVDNMNLNVVDLIETACGSDLTNLTSSVSILSKLVCRVNTVAVDIGDFFTCRNFNGLYATVAYDAVCYNGNTGLIWVAFSQFVIVLCAMIMLTLRVAFYEMVDESELLMVRERGRCCCKKRSNDPDADHGAEGLILEEQDIVEYPVSSKFNHETEAAAGTAAAATNGKNNDKSFDSNDDFESIVSSAVGVTFDENGGKSSSNEYEDNKATPKYHPSVYG